MCILREFSTCASSLNSGRAPFAPPGAPVPRAPPMAPMEEISQSTPAKSDAVGGGRWECNGPPTVASPLAPVSTLGRRSKPSFVPMIPAPLSSALLLTLLFPISFVRPPIYPGITGFLPPEMVELAAACGENAPPELRALVLPPVGPSKPKRSAPKSLAIPDEEEAPPNTSVAGGGPGLASNPSKSAPPTLLPPPPPLLRPPTTRPFLSSSSPADTRPPRFEWRFTTADSRIKEVMCCSTRLARVAWVADCMVYVLRFRLHRNV
mmetsp:Transcript_23048/g.41118  ORF Transcript_23048/g.41118 Transcript_23048/m.41118 type:complete len:264 (-) Transcript_23048:1-792(-)